VVPKLGTFGGMRDWMLLIVDGKTTIGIDHNNTALSEREREREREERNRQKREAIMSASPTTPLSPHLTSAYESTLRSSLQCAYIYTLHDYHSHQRWESVGRWHN